MMPEEKFIIETVTYTKKEYLRMLSSWGNPKLIKFVIMGIIFVCFCTLDLSIRIFTTVRGYWMYFLIIPYTFLVYVIAYFTFLPQIKLFILKIVAKKKKKKNNMPAKININILEDQVIFLGGSEKFYYNYRKLLRCEVREKDFLLRFEKEALILKKEDFILGTPEEFLKFIRLKTKVVTPKNRYGSY